MLIVRAGGLEPPRIAAPDPKSGLSTNFNTPACASCLKGQEVMLLGGLVALGDGEEVVCLEGSTADQATVDVGAGEEFLGV